MRVLLAVDGSEVSELAVTGVTGRTWPPGTVIRVLSVVENVSLPPMSMPFAPTVGLEPIQAGLESHARELTDRVAAVIERAGLPAEKAVRHGDPRAVIVEEAETWKADLLVVGSHGYRGLQRWLLGSVAQAVVEHAPCSVEVVRRPRKDTDTTDTPG